MTKILIFSDVHVHPHKRSSKRLQDCLDALHWTFQTARDKHIKEVLFLGDLFHDREKIQVLAYQKTFEIIRKFDDLTIHLLLGNHDLWYYDRWDVSSVLPLGAMKHVEVIDRPMTKVIEGLSIDFLPFTHDPLSILKDHFKIKSSVLCSHIAIDGAQLNKLYNTRSEVAVENDSDMVKVDVGLLCGWKKVFLGHYHGEQKLNDIIEYVGSPLQLSFNEAFQKKHVIIFDTDTMKQEYVENTFSPKHLIIDQDKIDDYDLENNFVEVNVENVDSLEILDLKKKIIKEHEVQHLEFRVKKKSGKVAEEVFQKFDITNGDVLERYVTSVGGAGLNLERLLRAGWEICSTK